MIPVSRPYLPDKERYFGYLDRMWESHVLTNGGPCVQKLESSIQEYLDVPYFSYVSNGTVALELLLGIFPKGEVIVTPFSFVATVSAVVRAGHTPVFVDIDPQSFCMSPDKVLAAMTAKTRCILATHVFGNSCDVDALANIGRFFGIFVLYDGAHAFGASLRGRSLLAYGNATTVSFHATKLFHTIEGGGIVTIHGGWDEQLKSLRNFGYQDGMPRLTGTNAKGSEAHAAMGLCLLPEVPNLIAERKAIHEAYMAELEGWLSLQYPVFHEDMGENGRNYIYFPVVLPVHIHTPSVVSRCLKRGVGIRQYFWPSLNLLERHPRTWCPVSEAIAEHVVCLPMYNGLAIEDVHKVCRVLREVLKEER